MTNISIPSGLIDDNIEMFTVAGTVMATHSGAVKHLFELPDDFLRIVKEEMYASESVIAALDLYGYNTEQAMIEKFCQCRFGGFNFTADFAGGRLVESEYYECGYRGACPMEGIVCNFFKVDGTIIIPIEMEMIKLLATEDTLPVIAEKLGMSKNTFDMKKQRLFEKLGVLSRARLVARCYDLQILNPVAACSAEE